VSHIGNAAFLHGTCASRFAQQTNPNSSARAAASADRTAPASQSVSTSGRGPLQPMTSEDFWTATMPNVVNLVSHPLPVESYVQRH
jgi:hypothetical protein